MEHLHIQGSLLYKKKKKKKKQEQLSRRTFHMLRMSFKAKSLTKLEHDRMQTKYPSLGFDVLNS